MRKFLYSGMLVLLLTVKISGQTPPQLIPPSPTAYSLGKYGDIPVSYYTGVPDISIPIFSLKDQNISADITLSYHGSGIKVDEQASFVGLGWSLNAGGVITRSVKGRAESLNSSGNMIPARTSIAFYNVYNHQDADDYIADNNIYAAASNITDNAPDEYFFNFNGRTGKFVFDNNGKAVLEKQEGLEINWIYISPDVQKFIIRDESGTIYEFFDFETTYYGGNDGTKISAWYLSKITSTTNEEIKFEYYGAIGSDNYSRSYSSTVFEITGAYADITPPVNAIYFSTYGMTEQRLHRITSAAGIVEFQYKNKNRLDYNVQGNTTRVASAALDAIIIYKPDHAVLKKTRLYTNYFVANNEKRFTGVDAGLLNFLNYRLRLDSVIDLNATEIPMQPAYTMKYLGDDDPQTEDVYTLPYRLSPAQDHWGYYNNSGNIHLFPGNPGGSNIAPDLLFSRLQGTSAEDQGTSRQFTGGADRETNAESAKACMLQTLTYPTGGYSTFDFESAVTNGFGGLRIKKIVNYPLTGKPVETQYTYGGSAGYDPRKFYYKLYSVTYHPSASGLSPVLPDEILQAYEIFDNTYASVNPRKYVKIVAAPQAILGVGSQVGYSSVGVKQAGNGAISYQYDALSTYPDLTEHLGLDPSETNKLDNLFNLDYVCSFPSVVPSSQYYSQYITTNDWPYPEIYSESWKRGVLTGKYIVSENNTLLKEEQHIYHRELLSAIPGYTVKQMRTGEFVYSKFYTPHARIFLDSTTVKEYDQNGLHPLTTTTKYYYDNTLHLQPTRTETFRSDRKKQVSLTTYPLDYLPGTGFIDNMVSNHILAYPVENITWQEIGSKKSIISGLITKYESDGSGRKSEQMVLENPTPLSSTAFKLSDRASGILPPNGIQTSFAPDIRYKSKIRFDQYDTKGNILQFTPSTSGASSFIWDYNSYYPIAQASNAKQSAIAFTSFEADGNGNWIIGSNTRKTTGYITGKQSYSLSNGAISSTVLPKGKQYIVSYWTKNLNPATVKANGNTVTGILLFTTPGGWKCYQHTTSTTVITIVITGNITIDELRLHPRDAQMTSYTYTPLVGMTSSNSSNNSISIFEYDDMHRLKLVRDPDGNIIKKNDYQYQLNSNQ